MFLTFIVNAQDKKWWMGTEYRYSPILNYSFKVNELNLSSTTNIGKNYMYSGQFNIMGGYFVHPQISVGAGLGIVKTKKVMEESFVPIFLDLRTFLKKDKSAWFAYGDFGSDIAKPDNRKNSFLFDLGVGYRLKTGKNFGINFTFGYNYQVFNQETDILIDGGSDIKRLETHFKRHSISFGVGISF